MLLVLIKALFVTTLLLATLGACNQRFIFRGTEIIYAEGPRVSQDFEVNDFNRLNLSGTAIVTFRYSDSHSVTVETAENIFEFLEISVRQGTFYFGMRSGVGINFGEYAPIITIYAPTIVAVNVFGSIVAADWDTISTDSLDINVAGSASINIDLHVQQLTMDISGSAHAGFSGTADAANINIAGSGNISAFDLQTSTTVINASGSVNISISVSDDLNVTAMGIAQISYRGTPTLSGVNLSGLARLTAVE